MSGVMLKPARQVGVLANYLSLLLFATVFSWGEYTVWTFTLSLIAILALLVLVISLYVTLIRTDLWRLTHTSIEKLDEREIQVTHTSLRYSYTIISLISLVTIAFITLSVRFSFFTLTHRGHYSFGLIVLICLLYLAQTLPASIIAWTEKHLGSA